MPRRILILLALLLLLTLPIAHAQSPGFSASRLEQKLENYVDSVRAVGFTFAALLATLGFLIRGISKLIPDTQFRTMASVWSTEMIVTAAVITAGVVLAPVLVEAIKELFMG